MAIVYAHVNKINGKIYIGQTTRSNVNQRWRDGNGYADSKLFYKAIQKYGWDNFDHQILYEGITPERALELECILIAILDTTNREKGYNLTTGGEHSIPTEEVRKKISNAISGEKNGMYGRTGEKNPYYGKKHTEEERYKMSLKASHTPWNKGIPMTDEAKRNLSIKATGRKSYMKGKHFSEEFCIKQRQIQKGLKHKPHEPEWVKERSRVNCELAAKYKAAKLDGTFTGNWNEYQKAVRSSAC